MIALTVLLGVGEGVFEDAVLPFLILRATILLVSVLGLVLFDGDAVAVPGAEEAEVLGTLVYAAGCLPEAVAVYASVLGSELVLGLMSSSLEFGFVSFLRGEVVFFAGWGDDVLGSSLVPAIEVSICYTRTLKLPDLLWGLIHESNLT